MKEVVIDRYLGIQESKNILEEIRNTLTEIFNRSLKLMLATF